MDINTFSKTFEVLAHYYSLNPLPYQALLIWLLFSVYYVGKAFRKYESINRYLLQMIPFVFTGLGLLGTIMGSLEVIWKFTPDDIMSGAVSLVKGILASGATAVLGITLAIIFSKLISMTHYKVEMRKALENNELYILKKMLKLHLTGFARDRSEAKAALAALHDVEQGIQRDAGSLVYALVGEDDVPLSDQLATEFRELRRELRDAVETLRQSGQEQTLILERIALSLSGDGPDSLRSLLQGLRKEQKQQAFGLKQGMDSLGETLGNKLDTGTKALESNLERLDASLGGVLNEQTSSITLCLTGQTQRLGESLEAASKDAAKLASELSRQLLADLSDHVTAELDRGVEATQDTLRNLANHVTSELEHGVEATHDALRGMANQQQEQQEATSRDIETLAGTAREQGNLLGRLHAQLAPEAGETLVQQLETIRHSLRQFGNQEARGRLQTQETMQMQLDALAQVRQELAELLPREQARAARNAAREALHEYAGALRPELERLVAKVDAGTGEGLRRLRTDISRQGDALHESLRSHTATLGGKLHELAANIQVSYNRIDELVNNTREIATDGDLLKALMQEANKALADSRELQNTLARGQAAGSNGNGRQHFPDKLGHSMQGLIARLGQIDAIKKTDERFWRQVERQMHDGIPIIMGGNKLSLHEDLNGSFQQRLQQSFLNLDRILQAIVDGYQRKGGQTLPQ
jgi:gas vesicle protein